MGRWGPLDSHCLGLPGGSAHTPRKWAVTRPAFAHIRLGPGTPRGITWTVLWLCGRSNHNPGKPKAEGSGAGRGEGLWAPCASRGSRQQAGRDGPKETWGTSKGGMEPPGDIVAGVWLESSDGPTGHPGGLRWGRGGVRHRLLLGPPGRRGAWTPRAARDHKEAV